MEEQEMAFVKSQRQKLNKCSVFAHQKIYSVKESNEQANVHSLENSTN